MNRFYAALLCIALMAVPATLGYVGWLLAKRDSDFIEVYVVLLVAAVGFVGMGLICAEILHIVWNDKE